jgi:diguanylate cyclase (GGDEF)-like protein
VNFAPGPDDEAPTSWTESSFSASDESPLHDSEHRLARVAEVIERYAALDFEVRAPISDAGDIVDAVAAGVNFLGEEIAASLEEVEERVRARTEELKLMTEELSRRALYDQLTGLANRTLLWDRVTYRFTVAKRRAAGFAVLFLDLDNLKAVNDNLGHAAGDQVLVTVAHRVREELRGVDTAARVGGDEFVVLLDEVTTAEEARAIAERLVKVLIVPFEVASRSERVTTSVGVAVAGDGLANADSLIGAADAAMYEAKRSGGGRCVVYDVKRHGPAGPRSEV